MIEFVVYGEVYDKKKGNMLRSVPKTVNTLSERILRKYISDVIGALMVSSSSLSFGNEGRRWYEKSAGRKKR